MILQAIQGVNTQVALGETVSLRCPACRHLGNFDRITSHDVQLNTTQGSYVVGIRRCPNVSCKNIIFFVFDHRAGKLAVSYPPELIDFDSTNVPASVTKALEEAISCHANECYIAAAIMVRKTLEELCHNRGATGTNLKERIRDLGMKVILPKELLEGLDDLRLLGNDAAHIESQEFNAIGKDEVEIGIEFTKEVLKSVFQYSDLLTKLRSLKRTP